MNKAMNEDFQIAYERLDKVLCKIHIHTRGGLMDVTEIPVDPCDICGAMARLILTMAITM